MPHPKAFDFRCKMPEAIQDFLRRVRDGDDVSFNETIALINEFYHYVPTRFSNGVGEAALVNEPGANEGSCRILSFAKLNGLSQAETLALFGEFYRVDVLGSPDGSNHANIRNFMRGGWAGVHFEGVALRPK